MSHLTPADVVDAVDGVLTGSRAAHLESCARCRAEAAAAHAAIVATRRADVPEPSPLYWQHLSARIREQVANERIAPASWTDAWSPLWSAFPGVRGLVPVASALALVIAVVGGAGLLTRHARLAAPTSSVAMAGTTAAATSTETLQPSDENEVWQVLSSAASDMPIEDAHAAGMVVQAGAIDRAVQGMTPDELNELGRLLLSEMGRQSE